MANVKTTVINHYEFDGVILDMPTHYDALADMHIEDYRNFNENPAWTDAGHPVIGAVEEACGYAETHAPDPCMDCGSCKFYTPKTPNRLIGICEHPKRLRAGINDSK